MTKRDDDKARTRTKIMTAARACFEGRGYEATTMRDIAKAAQMSTGAIFANWPGKEELFRAVMGRWPVSQEEGAQAVQHLRNMLEHIASEDPTPGHRLEAELFVARLDAR